MRFTYVAAFAAALFLFSCAPQQPDMTALKKTVDDYNAASRDAMMNGNTDKVLTYYEDDAMEMAPNMAMIKGRAAIKAFQDQMSKAGVKATSVSFNTTDLQAGGSVAFEVGTYDMSMTMPNGTEMKDNGKYVALWHQQADGSWKVHAETWNSDMPVPGMDQMMKKDEMKKKK